MSARGSLPGSDLMGRLGHAQCSHHVDIQYAARSAIHPGRRDNRGGSPGDFSREPISSWSKVMAVPVWVEAPAAVLILVGAAAPAAIRVLAGHLGAAAPDPTIFLTKGTDQKGIITSGADPKGIIKNGAALSGGYTQWDGSKGKHRRHGRHGYYYYPYDDFYGWPYDYGYDYDGYYYGNYYSGCNYYRHRWYVTHNRYWLRRYYQCLDY